MSESHLPNTKAFWQSTIDQGQKDDVTNLLWELREISHITSDFTKTHDEGLEIKPAMWDALSAQTNRVQNLIERLDDQPQQYSHGPLW